jgi:Na+-driven multidrug efflux pump
MARAMTVMRSPKCCAMIAPLSKDIFRGWKEFAVLGIPGSVSLFLEWGSYEVSASIAGRLGTIPLAVHTVFMQVCHPPLINISIYQLTVLFCSVLF